jgi:putative membrane protein
MESMIRCKVQRAKQEDTGWAVFFTATLFLIISTAPARAHIADGDRMLTDWHWRWDVVSVLVIFSTLYIRGWLRLRVLGGEAKLSQLGFYAIALIAIVSALLSPLDDLASYLLIAHMVQHELLIMVAPPFILLAKPVPVFLWGLGRNRRSPVRHLLTRQSAIRRVRDFLGWMPVAWSLYVINLWVWHHPAFYDAALRVPWIHDLEHVLFFLTALVFWWPVIQPVSLSAPIQHGMRILYLFFAATQDTILAGLIALSREVLYPHYQTALRLWGLTPQEDQIGGGIVMFAVGSATYAIAILILVNALLGEGRRKRSTKRTLSDGAEKIESRI